MKKIRYLSFLWVVMSLLASQVLMPAASTSSSVLPSQARECVICQEIPTLESPDLIQQPCAGSRVVHPTCANCWRTSALINPVINTLLAECCVCRAKRTATVTERLQSSSLFNAQDLRAVARAATEQRDRLQAENNMLLSRQRLNSEYAKADKIISAMGIAGSVAVQLGYLMSSKKINTMPKSQIKKEILSSAVRGAAVALVAYKSGEYVVTNRRINRHYTSGGQAIGVGLVTSIGMGALLWKILT